MAEGVFSLPHLRVTCDPGAPHRSAFKCRHCGALVRLPAGVVYGMDAYAVEAYRFSEEHERCVPRKAPQQ